MKVAILAVVLFCSAVVSAGTEDSAVTPMADVFDERYELAKELFAPLSFNIGDYFYIQEDLKQYVSQLSVEGSTWEELKRHHDKKDYLGMLGVIKKEKLHDYPPAGTIRKLHAELIGNGLSAPFRLKASFTHKVNVVCRAFPGKNTGGLFLGTDYKNILFQFRMKAGKCFYIYSPDDQINAMIKQYGNARDTIREDMKMARIFKEDGEAKIARLCEKQFRDTLKWLATAKVSPGDAIADRKPLPPSFWKSFSGSGRKNTVARRAENVEALARDSGTMATENSVRMSVCEECKGKRTVQDVKTCIRCNGTGFSPKQAADQGSSGKDATAKGTMCPLCKGKGTMCIGLKPCNTCKGKGKVVDGE